MATFDKQREKWIKQRAAAIVKKMRGWDVYWALASNLQDDLVRAEVFGILYENCNGGLGPEQFPPPITVFAAIYEQAADMLADR